MSLRASVSIVRPINCAMIGFAVVVGALVSKPPSPISPMTLLLGALTGFMVCAYSMAINDYYDVEIDRVNQPDRPLPSGRISMRTALAIALLTLAVGMMAAVLTALISAVLIASFYAFLSWLYNYWGKRHGLWGNAMVASSLAIPFIYGGAIVLGQVGNSLLLFMALTAFLSGVGREVVKAMADTAGDAKKGVRSFAIAHGLRGASVVGALLFGSAVVTSLIPVVEELANPIYAYAVVMPDLIFLYLAVAILRKATAENALKVKKRALLGMLVGLIVFVGGAF